LLYRGGTGLIPDSYLRFLTREIRKRWDYEGVSLVLAPKGAR
jgi:predicted GTPase